MKKKSVVSSKNACTLNGVTWFDYIGYTARVPRDGMTEKAFDALVGILARAKASL